MRGLGPLGLLCLVAACRPLPEGWVYVTGVTTTAATVVWTGTHPGDVVACRGRRGPIAAPVTQTGKRGLRYARVEPLEPATAYSCRIGTRGRRVRFRTAPPAGTRFRFAVVGDTGDASPEAAAIARRVRATHPAFLIHLGDMAYGRPGADGLDARFFRPYAATLARVPLFPTPGNHDLHRQSVYRLAFAPVASDGDAALPHYAFDWGDAHFASVSTPEVAAGGDGGRWLADDLRAAGGRPWRIVFLHEPPFGPVGKWVDHGLRTTLQPIVEAGGVELLLTGHEHVYERADPACAYVPDAAVLQVVSGGGGGHLDKAVDHPSFARVVAATHIVHVTVTPDALDIRAVDLHGNVLDRFRRRRDTRLPCRKDGWPVRHEK